MGTLDGKVAIIAGGATNQGAESARLMAKQGAKVVVGDLNIKDAEATAAEIRKEGGEAVAFKFDLTNEAEIKAMVEFTVKKYGGVDVLHNSAAAIGAIAGDMVGQDQSTDVVTMDMNMYDRTMVINLRGFILTIRYVVPEMIKRGGGSIINTSSFASIEAGAHQHAYAISKAGVNQLTRCVAAAYGKDRIRCNAILPGPILRTGNIHPDRAARAQQQKPGPKTGEPKDIANMAVFLASDETAGYVNGALIPVDGGPMGRGPGLPERPRGM